MKILFKNGKRKEMTYEEVCKKLGMIPEIHFVDVKEDGKIGFTAGKKNELKTLKERIEEAGMVPTDYLKEEI